MMWNLYANGYRKQYANIKEAFDDEKYSIEEEIKCINKKSEKKLFLSDFEKLQQPFPNNEHIGKFTGGMFSKYNNRNCIFEMPPEDTQMHIIVLGSMDSETHYLIRSDVAEYYFGDKDWNDHAEKNII
jgi:hypothetical protein